jgi:hypothetical protein
MFIISSILEAGGREHEAKYKLTDLHFRAPTMMKVPLPQLLQVIC